MLDVKNTYAKVILGTWLVAAAALLSCLLGFALKTLDVGGWSYFFFAAPVLIFCLIAQPIWYSVGRLEQRELQQLLEGNRLAHWTYSREDCVRFAKSEWRRTTSKVPRLLLSVIGTMMLVGVGFAWLDGGLSLLNGFLYGGALGVLLGILVGLVFCAYEWIAHQTRLAGPAEAYVGNHGVYQHGRYVSWGLPWLTLSGVTLETGDPSALYFEIKGRRGGVQELSVMVPKGKETDAKRLLAHFPGVRPSPSHSGSDRSVRHRKQ